MWVILLNNADWDCFKTSGGTLCIFGSHTFVPTSWMCKKQTAVSRSSTESEIISQDAGLRLDGLLALKLWDLIVSVFGSVSQISDLTTMRHVSRTHRVALDWLFDRINLDPKIQIKYIDTKNLLADILTKWKFHT